MSIKKPILLLLCLPLVACSGESKSQVSSDADVQTEEENEKPEIDAGMEEPVEVVLHHADLPCAEEDYSTIAPYIPDEVGHYAATRLTPEDYPFEVTGISYTAGSTFNDECNGGLAHTVELYVVSSQAPTASPSSDGTLAQTHAVDAIAGTDAPYERKVDIELADSIVLEDGQSLVVAVKQTGNDPDSPTVATCLLACQSPGSVAGVDYWSNAAAEPFAWADMVTDFGFTQNFVIAARGKRVAQ
jgi:hypothetical protein